MHFAASAFLCAHRTGYHAEQAQRIQLEPLHRTVLQCRQRDSEIAALRTSLAERDSKAQASRSELAELQLQVKSHEHSLQHAYNQLAEASRDKARVRQQLLENQAELTGVSPCCAHLAAGLLATLQMQLVADVAVLMPHSHS